MHLLNCNGVGSGGPCLKQFLGIGKQTGNLIKVLRLGRSFSVCELPQGVRNEQFPYTLATVRSEGQFNTIVYEDHDSYRGAPHRWCVLIGPADLERLGVASGDRVTLRSAHGVMPGVEVHEFPLPAGDVLAYFPEANVLTGTAVDPRSKTPAFKSVPVAISVSDTKH